MIRLHVQTELASDAIIAATERQAHYLATVMRRSVGDAVTLFNGCDGEWASRITAMSRGTVSLIVEALVRPQAPDADLWLLFAVLKRDATDLVVRQATELGVSVLLPVFTQWTNAARVNLDRLRCIAIEAAEQSERLTVPELQPARPLHDVLLDWPDERTLFVALEREDVRAVAPNSGPGALLIGPEGGFGPRDHALLKGRQTVRALSLGPRILRAETAAVAGLALLQARKCG